MPEAWKDTVRATVNDQLQRRREADPRYSLRKLAHQLKISPSSLSEFLRGIESWELTSERAASIIRALELSPDQSTRLLTILHQEASHTFHALPEDDQPILLRKHYFPILIAFDLPPAHRTTEKIAKLLEIPEREVQDVVNDLIKRGYLQQNKDGEVSRKIEILSSTDGPSRATVRQHHHTNLELAHHAIDHVPVEERDFTSMTFVGNQDFLENVRAEIRLFHERVAALMNDRDKNDKVYRLSVQLFPIRFASTSGRGDEETPSC